MFDFLLSTNVTVDTLSEKLTLGGQVTLVGMGTVFSILALLWGLVELLHLILKPFSENKNSKFNPPAVVAAAPSIESGNAQASDSDELEIIAAITAAIAQAQGVSPSSFRVVSFKRANNKFSQGK